jgi:hypothetical protein
LYFLEPLRRGVRASIFIGVVDKSEALVGAFDVVRRACGGVVDLENGVVVEFRHVCVRIQDRGSGESDFGGRKRVSKSRNEMADLEVVVCCLFCRDSRVKGGDDMGLDLERDTV